VIYCDNLSSIQLAKNPVFHARTKHIEVHYHFVQERVLSGEVELKYVPTDRQVADIFTKSLGLDNLRQFSGALGLRHLDVPNLRGREPEPEREREPEPEGPGLRSDRSEKADSESEVDSDMPNKLRCPGRAEPPAQIRRTHGRFSKMHGKRHGRDNIKAVKGKVLTGGLTKRPLSAARAGNW
jgi:hypothetical protein